MMEKELERKQREAQQELAREWEKIEQEKARLKGKFLDCHVRNCSKSAEEAKKPPKPVKSRESKRSEPVASKQRSTVKNPIMLSDDEDEIRGTRCAFYHILLVCSHQ